MKRLRGGHPATMIISSPGSASAPGWRRALDIIATLAMIAASGFVVWRMAQTPTSANPTRPSLAVPSNPIDVSNRPQLGSTTAHAAMIVVSDFQCPFCGKFAASTMKEIKSKYVDSGQVQLFFLNNPLDMHPLAPKAAEAALCANAQNRFWPMHDLLFSNLKALDEPSLIVSAGGLGLDMVSFRSCLAGQTATAVDADRALARTLGIQMTPSFLFGTINAQAHAVTVQKTLAGALPFEDFDKALSRLVGQR